TASVTVSDLAEDGRYHWQSRTTDQTMRASPWTSFGDNPETATDFHVAVPEPPNAPTGLGQFKGDGIAELTLGTTTAERTVVFKGTVTDPDPGDQIRLEIETKPLSTTFDSLNTTLGTAVASGSQASVTVANQGDDQSYHWRARAVDQSGRTSAWVNFGPNLESEADYRIVVPEPPGIDPASLAQFEANGTTTIATGATTVENTVVLRATLTDPDPGDQVLLDVELRPATQAFTGIPTHSGSLGPAGSVQITAADLPDDIDYHWRARARDQADSASAWMSFGGNPEGARDFRVAVPQDPNPPAELRQLKSGGADSIPVGDTARTNAIVFRTRLTDPDQGDQLRLEVEWKLVGSPFNEMDTDTSAAVASGDTVTLAASGLLDDEAYHWRVRALDQLGRRSAWASYGGNADGAVDFRVAVPQDPAAPTSLQQFESDGTTAIPPAGTTADATVVFKATVSDPDPGDQLRLQVEVQPVGTDFTNSPSATGSTAVGDGNVASVSFGPLGNATDYHWRVRAIDQTGRPGPWAALATPEKDFRVDIPGAPGLPTSLQQFRGDSTTVIPQAAIIGSTTVVLKATVSDAENDMVRLEVEVKPTRAFTGSNTVRGELVASGSVAAVRVSNLDDDSDYHWRARAVDATGLASGWVEFGTTERDFRVQVPERPALDAASLAQFKIDATTPIGIGGTTDQNTVVLKATLTDPDPGDQVLLDLEVRPVTEDFTGTPTHSGNLGPAGSAQIAVTDRLDNTS
ncbi:MAG: hypothetical protein HY560_11155, partial [Gemmatimonadetes bacterium]|nr:hypothetical protein [Gemmatimonadota bacterium]